MPDIILIGKRDEVIALKIDVTDKPEEITRCAAVATGIRQQDNIMMMQSIFSTPSLSTIRRGINADIHCYIDF
ncbi:hypothetical protein D3C85_1773810 [compost metagenome]